MYNVACRQCHYFKHTKLSISSDQYIFYLPDHHQDRKNECCSTHVLYDFLDPRRPWINLATENSKDPLICIAINIAAQKIQKEQLHYFFNTSHLITRRRMGCKFMTWYRRKKFIMYMYLHFKLETNRYILNMYIHIYTLTKLQHYKI